MFCKKNEEKHSVLTVFKNEENKKGGKEAIKKRRFKTNLRRKDKDI